MSFQLWIALILLVLSAAGIAYVFHFIMKISRIAEEERERW